MIILKFIFSLYVVISQQPEVEISWNKSKSVLQSKIPRFYFDLSFVDWKSLSLEL